LPHAEPGITGRRCLPMAWTLHPPPPHGRSPRAQAGNFVSILVPPAVPSWRRGPFSLARLDSMGAARCRGRRILVDAQAVARMHLAGRAFPTPEERMTVTRTA